MKRTVTTLFAVLLACSVTLVSTSHAGADDAQADTKRYVVETHDFIWHDNARKRDVPVRIYLPHGDEPCPLIVFSHGLGGSREHYAYLGRHWAKHGYISLHLQHIGSDDSVWRGKKRPMVELRRAAADLQNSINRPLDVTFVIDHALALDDDEDSPLHGRIIADRIGIAGHSYGAFTTLASAGQVFPMPGGRKLSLGDKRIRAGIPMSAPVPVHGRQRDLSYGPIAIPLLHMTGTLDDSPIGNSGPEDRRIPFDHIDKADQFLVTFTDGDHMVFSGRTRRGEKGELDRTFHDIIQATTLDFWNRYLRGDPDDDSIDAYTQSLRDAVGEYGKVEVKAGKAQAAEAASR